MLNKNERYMKENKHLVSILRQYSEDLYQLDQNEMATLKLFMANTRVVIRSKGFGSEMTRDRFYKIIDYLNSVV